VPNLTPAQLTQLRTEINTDPNGRGYAPLRTAMNDAGLATALNLPRTGANGGPAITFRRANIASSEILNAVVVADYPALQANPSAAQLSSERRYLSWLTALMAVPQVRLSNDDGTDAPAMVNLKVMFNGTPTGTRLGAIATRFGSVAEFMFGQFVVLTDSDVSQALAPDRPQT
jgi:hypothetical protein